MTKQFEIRTSFAGVSVTQKHLAASKKISKQFASFKVLWHSDKSVGCEIDQIDFYRFEREHERAGIAYIIED